MAFAPPPGTTLRSRCLRIKTGASRETREISPNTNSSAKISDHGDGDLGEGFNDLFEPFGLFGMLGHPDSEPIMFLNAEADATLIFSCRTAALFNRAKHGIQGV